MELVELVDIYGMQATLLLFVVGFVYQWTTSNSKMSVLRVEMERQKADVRADTQKTVNDMLIEQTRRADGLQARLDNMADKYDKLRDQYAEERVQAHRIQAELAAALAQLAAANKRNEAMQQTITELSKRVDQLEAQVAELEKDKAYYMSLYEQEKERAQKLQDQLEASNAQIEALTARLLAVEVVETPDENNDKQQTTPAEGDTSDE